MKSMANPHPKHMSYSAKQFAELQRNPTTGNVSSTQSYEAVSPTAQSQSRLNRGSNAFVFSNQQIAQERGRPNALGKETMGTVYGGSIGEN